MKRTLLLAIMAGAALAGCVKNEPIGKGDSSPERITFEAPVVSVPTRATEIYGNYPKGNNFAVYALHHDEGFVSYDASALFMDNVTCTAKMANGNAVGANTPDYWAPDADYYWPKKGKLTFAAYAPAMTNTVSASSPDQESEKVKWDANGFTFKNFEVKDLPADQIDLLYSDLVKDKTSDDMLGSENKAPYQGITIPFKHALSSIVFKAKTDVATTTNVRSIKLTDIKVKNVAKTGTFEQLPTATWTINEAADRKEYVIYDTGKPALLLGAAPVFVNGEPDNGGDGTGDINNDGEVNDADVESYDTQVKEEYPNDPTNNNDGVRRSDLIVIPQPLNNVTVEIKYTIVYDDEKGGLEVVEENTVEYNLGKSTASWDIGKRYIYTISIGLDKIYFNPTVQNWTDVESNIEI